MKSFKKLKAGLRSPTTSRACPSYRLAPINIGLVISFSGTLALMNCIQKFFKTLQTFPRAQQKKNERALLLEKRL